MAQGSLFPNTKTCTHCKVSKPATLDHFVAHRLGKYGIHSWCIPCKRAIDASRRERTDQKVRQQAWRDANKDYVKRYNDKYRKTHKSTEATAAWRSRNLDLARKREREKMARLRKTDPAFLLLGRVRGRLRHMIKDKGGRSSVTLLGYTSAQLKQHIERQFTRGMSWARVHSGEIEIDHIIPVRMFSITSADDPDFRVCWGLPNLRPMWAKDNRSKGGKVLTLL